MAEQGDKRVDISKASGTVLKTAAKLTPILTREHREIQLYIGELI
jgi:hypothetical protein